MINLPEEYNWVDINPDLEKALDLIINSDKHMNILGPAGCLTGDTKIRISRASKGFYISLKELYLKFNKLGGKGLTWNYNIPTYIRSYDEKNNVVKLNNIIRVFESGVKDIFKLTLENGFELKGTHDHKIMTSQGWVELSKLNISHYVLVDLSISRKPTLVKVSKVENLNYQEMTYDITCDDPFHSFVANNIIVHNCGKTLLLKMICDDKILKGNKVVLSSTGIAAVNASSEGISGSTVHSFFKFKPQTIYSPSQIYINKDLYEIINEIDVLIIDEISMINASLFDFMIETLIHYRSKQFKNIPRIILFGDILQLPPVIDMSKPDIQKYFNDIYNGKYMYFNSYNFTDYGFETVHLNTIYRQKDNSFQNILNRIRQGSQTKRDLDFLNSYVIAEEDFFEKKDMYLYISTTNKKVNEINDINMEIIDSKPYIYNATIKGIFDLASKPMLQDRIILKKDAQIMCIKNSANGEYKNGSLGRVIECFENTVEVQLANGLNTTVEREEWKELDYAYDSETKKIEVKEKGVFNQIGCKPASALTVWKTQGQTLDNAYIDFERWTPEATCYVALSRLKSLDGLGLKRPISAKDVKVSKESLDFLSKI